MATSDRTKRDIKQALTELCEEMPFERVSVRLICDKAGISRQTFYQYYRDKYEVSIALQQQVLGDNFTQLGKTIGWREAYLNTFREMEKYHTAMASMQRSRDVNAIMLTAERNSLRDFEQCYIDRYGESPSGLIAFQMKWFSHFATDVPAYWIAGGCEPPADEFIDYFVTLIPKELRKALDVGNHEKDESVE